MNFTQTNTSTNSHFISKHRVYSQKASPRYFSSQNYHNPSFRPLRCPLSKETVALYLWELHTHTHRICFSFNYKHLEFIIQVLFLRKFTLPGFMLTFALLVIMWMRDTCRHFYLFLWTFSLSSETGINICYIGLRIHPARFLRIGVTCPVRWMWFF